MRYLNIVETGKESINPGDAKLVKIQVSLGGEGKMLVYNEDRSIFFERPITKAIKKFMSGGPKRYAIIKMDNGGGFSIVKPAPEQDW